MLWHRIAMNCYTKSFRWLSDSFKALSFHSFRFGPPTTRLDYLQRTRERLNKSCLQKIQGDLQEARVNNRSIEINRRSDTALTWKGRASYLQCKCEPQRCWADWSQGRDHVGTMRDFPAFCGSDARPWMILMSSGVCWAKLRRLEGIGWKSVFRISDCPHVLCAPQYCN
jgi:hypothetical protein